MQAAVGPERWSGDLEAASWTERRAGDRRRVAMEVRVLGRGLRRDVGHATDLSLSGCRLACGSLRAGDEVQLRLGGIAGIRAEVVWTSGPEAGVRFHLPLHTAVLEHLWRGR